MSSPFSPSTCTPHLPSVVFENCVLADPWSSAKLPRIETLVFIPLNYLFNFFLKRRHLDKSTKGGCFSSRMSLLWEISLMAVGVEVRDGAPLQWDVKMQNTEGLSISMSRLS